MPITAFAFDYDGTLARDGQVDDATTTALLRLKAAGLKLLLVSGRLLPELQQIYPRHDIFDLLVAENGALLYRPTTREQRALAPPPPEPLLQALRRTDVQPLSIGCSIIATRRSSESKLLAAIHDAQVAWHVIANKDAVMALPAGVDKASGLAAALQALQISPGNVLAVGDAENDLVLFTACGYGAAVANAVDPLKRAADVVMQGDHGDGVLELIERFLHQPDELTGRLTGRT